MVSFKIEYSLENRKELMTKIKQTYPDRIPIILEPRVGSSDPQTKKKKFLVPSGSAMYVLFQEFRKHISGINSGQTVVFLTNNTMINSGSSVDEIYTSHQDEDGFLYITYTTENVFGDIH